MDTAENVNVHTRQWHLQPESEYRFELDPRTTIAIKVRLAANTYTLWPRATTPLKEDPLARQWPCGDIWGRARGGQNIPLWTGVQGGSLHMAGMHHRDEYHSHMCKPLAYTCAHF